MPKDPAFLFYPKDFLEGTSEMTYEEMGVYIKLLSHQWLRGGLPSDMNRISRLLKIPLNDLEGYPYIFEKFTIDGDRMFNERLEEERIKRGKFKESASLSGVKGQFLKQQKSIMKAADFKKLEIEINALDITNIRDKGTLKGMLKGCLSNKGNGNGDVNTGKEVILKNTKLIYENFKKEKDSNDRYKAFVDFLYGNNITGGPLENVLLLNQQISPTSFKSLLEKYSREDVKSVIEDMSSKDLNKYKITSFTMAVNSWCRGRRK